LNAEGIACVGQALWEEEHANDNIRQSAVHMAK
jgi:hypothetical protein